MPVANDRVSRIVALLRALEQPGSQPKSALSRAVGAAPRTVLDDLKALEAAGAVRRVGEGVDQRWELEVRDEPRPKGILDGIALRLGRDLLTFLDGTGLSDVFDRLEQTTDSGRWSRNLDQKFVHLQEPARRYADQADVLDTLIDALVKEKRIAIRYRGLSFEERGALTVRPLTLVLYRRAVYLLALDDREDILRLAVDRIQEAVIGDPFEYPSDWRPADELAPYFGILKSGMPERVVLRFAAAKADLVRARAWHGTERLETLPDGRVQLVMRVGGLELVRFVLEWGPHCEVVAPSWLRDKVVQELKGALDNYADSPRDEGSR